MTNDPYAGERLKKSAFYPREKVLNIRNAWRAWNGYKFAEYYYDGEYEYFCVRNTCGTYNICPMQKYHVTGKDAEAMLNRMVTRDVKKIGLNRVAYVLWCTDEGRMIDDGTIFKLSSDKFMLTCGSPCTAWLRKSAFGFDDVTVTDVTESFAALSLQGPTSCATLKKMGLDGIDTAKPFDIMHFPFHGDTLMVSRTGFTGDLGYELWIQPGLALEMWDELYAAGEDYGIQPFGEAATNMARLEAAFIMPAMEFNEALRTVHFEHDQTTGVGNSGPGGRAGPPGSTLWPFAARNKSGPGDSICKRGGADAPNFLDLPGYELHPLKGKLKGIWSVKLSGNWRIIFRLTDGDAFDVDLIDYH